MDVRLENTTQRLTRVHEASECMGPVCAIHRRSQHAMRGWPQYWRDDRALMERICPRHGVGHPDPDHLTAYEARHGMDAAYGESIHGCCGCCDYEPRGDHWAGLAVRRTALGTLSACPYDTDGDGNCGRRYCPDCGGKPPVLLKETPMPDLDIAAHAAPLPPAWRNLLIGLTILAKHPGNPISPFHCEHDQLSVMADPADFTADELEYLAELGFRAGRSGSDDEGTFYSTRYGSA